MFSFENGGQYLLASARGGSNNLKGHCIYVDNTEPAYGQNTIRIVTYKEYGTLFNFQRFQSTNWYNMKVCGGTYAGWYVATAHLKKNRRCLILQNHVSDQSLWKFQIYKNDSTLCYMINNVDKLKYTYCGSFSQYKSKTIGRYYINAYDKTGIDGNKHLFRIYYHGNPGLQQNLENKDNIIQNLRNTVTNLQNSLNAERNRSKNLQEDLNYKTATSNQTILNLQAKNKELIKNNQQLKTKNSIMNEKVRFYQQNKSDVQGYQEQIQRLQNQKQAIQRLLQQQRQNSQKQFQFQGPNQQMQIAQDLQQFQVLTQKHQQLFIKWNELTEKYQGLLGILIRTIQTQKSQKRLEAQLYRNYKQMEAKVQTMSSQMQQKNQIINNLQSLVEDKDTQLRKLEQEIDKMRQDALKSDLIHRQVQEEKVNQAYKIKKLHKQNKKYIEKSMYYKTILNQVRTLKISKTILDMFVSKQKEDLQVTIQKQEKKISNLQQLLAANQIQYNENESQQQEQQQGQGQEQQNQYGQGEQQIMEPQDLQNQQQKPIYEYQEARQRASKKMLKFRQSDLIQKDDLDQEFEDFYRKKYNKDFYYYEEPKKEQQNQEDIQEQMHYFDPQLSFQQFLYNQNRLETYGSYSDDNIIVALLKNKLKCDTKILFKCQYQDGGMFGIGLFNIKNGVKDLLTGPLLNQKHIYEIFTSKGKHIYNDGYSFEQEQSYFLFDHKSLLEFQFCYETKLASLKFVKNGVQQKRTFQLNTQWKPESYRVAVFIKGFVISVQTGTNQEEFEGLMEEEQAVNQFDQC